LKLKVALVALYDNSCILSLPMLLLLYTTTNKHHISVHSKLMISTTVIALQQFRYYRIIIAKENFWVGPQNCFDCSLLIPRQNLKTPMLLAAEKPPLQISTI
jgi:hypothetical protein